MKTKTKWLGLTASSALMFGVASLLTAQSDAKPTGGAIDGKALFEAGCAACHQKDGLGKAGLAPGIGNADFLRVADDAFIHRVVKEGRTGTAMMARPDLTKPQVQAIINYLRKSAGNVQKVAIAEMTAKGSEKDGAEHYKKHCSYCHGANANGYLEQGVGPAIGNPAFLKQASDTFIYQTLKIGRHGTAMRSFDGAKGLSNLSDQALQDLIVFLRAKEKAPQASVKNAATHAKAPVSYATCTACHGAAGEGNAAMKAPVLAGQSDWYVAAQLKKFKLGHRGTKAGDLEGMMMRPMALALTDAQMKELGQWLSKLPKVKTAATLKGNAVRGKAAYATCLACHGPTGEGNVALKAPGLTGQADWYLLSQLKKFKSGHRGTTAGDMEGMMMRPMALTLDEQKMKDIIAYIHSLEKK